MDFVSCPLCGSYQSTELYHLQDYNTGQPGNFIFVRCGACQLIYLNPRPSIHDIDRYYPETYGPHLEFGTDRAWPKRWMKEYGLRKRCQPLLRDSRPGQRLLDVGCGTGQYLLAMKKRGWSVVGVDVSRRAVDYVTTRLGLEAYTGHLEDLHFADETFDAITLWDSLEHMHNPQCVLNEAHRLLKRGGSLLLRVPSADSLDARLFKASWAGLDAPRHLVVFSYETLAHLLLKAGFAPERAWCMSGGHASFVISLRFHLSRQHHDSRIWLAALKTVASPIGALVGAPYFFIVDKLRRGPELAVIARK